MNYLLDTNACIQFLNGTSQPLVQRLRSHRPAEIALCSVVKGELIFGARHSDREAENLETLRDFFEPFVSFPMDDVAARHYGEIRAYLVDIGKTIGPNDLLIAAIARANALTLVTHNTGEFERVPNLAIEDWQS